MFMLAASLTMKSQELSFYDSSVTRLIALSGGSRAVVSARHLSLSVDIMDGIWTWRWTD